jgi:hypothetical protein
MMQPTATVPIPNLFIFRSEINCGSCVFERTQHRAFIFFSNHHFHCVFNRHRYAGVASGYGRFFAAG